MFKKLFMFALLGLTAMGCASGSGEVVKKTDPAIKDLNQTAKSVQTDLEKLSKIKQANFEQVKTFDSPQSGPLAEEATLKWSGPVDKALEEIAEKIGYELKVRGEPPASSVLVDVDQIDTTVFEILENIGWKIGKHRVNVDAEKELIQLTYFDKG